MTSASRRALRLFAGMIVGNAIGGALLLVTALLARAGAAGSGAESIVLADLILIPFCIGLTSAWAWQQLNVASSPITLHSLSCLVVGVAGAVVVLHEGAICLIIASPLLYLFILLGAELGGIWFKTDSGRRSSALIPLFMLVTVAEPMTRGEHTEVVTDEILINASPARVWRHITSFPTIQALPQFWLFKLGLPMPMSTTSEGDFIGASRRCVFSGGAVFRERVVEIDSNVRLTFDIIEQPANPELIGHLTAERGQFLLRDNHDGTTTLIGSTWYSLHARPLWYFDAWTRYIFREVHLRVMENVKAEAQRDGAEALSGG